MFNKHVDFYNYILQKFLGLRFGLGVFPALAASLSDAESPKVSHAPTTPASPTEVTAEQRKSRMRATRIVGCSVYCFAGFRIHLGGRPLVAPWVDGHFVVVSRLFVGVSQRKESIKNRNGRERGSSFFLNSLDGCFKQISSRLEP